MSIKLASINIQGHHHLDKIIPFLKTEKPDVICLQEVFEADLPRFEQELGMRSYFAPMTNVTQKTIHIPVPRGILGVAQLTKLSVKKTQKDYYVGQENQIPIFFHQRNPNSLNRCLLTNLIQKEDKQFEVATTHFTWSKNGQTSSLQLKNFADLKQILKKYSDLILCGDFNAPRGKEIFSELSAMYKDNIPQEVTTTIDPKLHKARGLQLVVDGLFTSDKYAAKEVKVVSGVSDHQAIVAEIWTQEKIC